MNKAFLEDLKKETGFDDVAAIYSKDISIATLAQASVQLYIAEKLWEISQSLKYQGQR